MRKIYIIKFVYEGLKKFRITSLPVVKMRLSKDMEINEIFSYWDDVAAKRKDCLSPPQIEVLPFVRDLCGKSVLDIGCGDGKILAELNMEEKYGMDISLKTLKLAKKRNPTAMFINANAEKLPFKDSSIDNIISTYTIEHLKNPKSFVQEIYRVLKKGGIAIVTTDNILFYAMDALLKKGKTSHPRKFDKPFFSFQFKKLFRNFHEAEFHYLVIPFKRFNIKIKPLGAYMLVKVRK